MKTTWERIEGAAGGSCGATHYYGDTGWCVSHCGHPTANFPYLIFTPTGRRILAPNGRAWRLLKDAKKRVEELHAGIPVTTPSAEVWR